MESGAHVGMLEGATKPEAHCCRMTRPGTSTLRRKVMRFYHQLALFLWTCWCWRAEVEEDEKSSDHHKNREGTDKR
ncbi:hypothetical protein E2C01_036222 [Portunus trituberculatus]|uniref:Uncharacterized protein n=1 Tax=Portunus trituberculatus TaxID=210409 RepID=A0A5B7FBH4_PORTR|nr:hypothetical protein [Portunus trituberculatus]